MTNEEKTAQIEKDKTKVYPTRYSVNRKYIDVDIPEKF